MSLLPRHFPFFEISTCISATLLLNDTDNIAESLQTHLSQYDTALPIALTLFRVDGVNRIQASKIAWVKFKTNQGK